MECYCVARNKPIRCVITKPLTATVIKLWFWGLLAYPELYCDWTVLHGLLSLTVIIYCKWIQKEKGLPNKFICCVKSIKQFFQANFCGEAVGTLFIPPSTLHDNIQPCLLTLALVSKVMRVTIVIGLVLRGQSDGVNKTDWWAVGNLGKTISIFFHKLFLERILLLIYNLFNGKKFGHSINSMCQTEKSLA